MSIRRSSTDAPFWSTGITLQFHPEENGWTASVEFTDRAAPSARDSVSIEGELHTRLVVCGADAGLRAARAVKADAERFGVEFRACGQQAPALYLHESNWISEDDEAGTAELEAVLRTVAEAFNWWPGARAFVV